MDKDIEKKKKDLSIKLNNEELKEKFKLEEIENLNISQLFLIEEELKLNSKIDLLELNKKDLISASNKMKKSLISLFLLSPVPLISSIIIMALLGQISLIVGILMLCYGIMFSSFSVGMSISNYYSAKKIAKSLNLEEIEKELEEIMNIVSTNKDKKNLIEEQLKKAQEELNIIINEKNKIKEEIKKYVSDNCVKNDEIQNNVEDKEEKGKQKKLK